MCEVPVSRHPPTVVSVVSVAVPAEAVNRSPPSLVVVSRARTTPPGPSEAPTRNAARICRREEDAPAPGGDDVTANDDEVTVCRSRRARKDIAHVLGGEVWEVKPVSSTEHACVSCAAERVERKGFCGEKLSTPSALPPFVAI